ncbi:MAG: hypothetical protein H0U76_19475 [Ktedonobacteraceae bacterium]|nr:hypothetical protein [Ktedonobacteraceae bacterium]
MSEHNLSFRPDISPEGADPRICETTRQYLAVWDDLTTEQRNTVAAHVRDCPSCSTEHLAMNEVTRLVATLEASSPSARVDRAVMEAIAAQSKHGRVLHLLPISRKKSRTNTFQVTGLLIAAAVVLIATFTTVRFIKTPSSTGAFLLPTTLSWSTYILYHSQTKIDAKGKRYRIASYHQFSSGYLNVETVQSGVVDVVLVDDGQNNLGMDEMHHIAQENVQGWGIDMSQEALFNLNEVRHEINTHQASYLDTDSFRGTNVYRIRCENGLVLLLDMSYKPVNILAGAVGPGTGEPIYDTVSLLPPSKVPSSMWDMQVPAGFRMGTLPAQP